MKIKELMFMLDELNHMKSKGGKFYKEAEQILESEVITDNIVKAMELIERYYYEQAQESIRRCNYK